MLHQAGSGRRAMERPQANETRSTERLVGRKPMTRAALIVRIPFAVSISTARRHKQYHSWGRWGWLEYRENWRDSCTSYAHLSLWGIWWRCITVSES